MLVALLATMKAGCAYVPLDPTHPSARLRHILTDAKVAALITDGSVDASVVPAGTATIHLKSEIGDIAASSLDSAQNFCIQGHLRRMSSTRPDQRDCPRVWLSRTGLLSNS